MTVLSFEPFNGNNHIIPVNIQKEQLHLAIPCTNDQRPSLSTPWLSPTIGEDAHKGLRRRSWTAFMPRRKSSQSSAQSRSSLEMGFSSKDEADHQFTTNHIPVTPTKKKRSSWVDSPIPAPLQQISTHSTDKIVKHAQFDPVSGNYRRYGTSNWIGFVAYCERNGVPEQLPKCFIYKGDKVLEDQLRLCVLNKLVHESLSVLRGLSMEDRLLLDNLWQANGGRPKHMGPGSSP